MFSIPLFGRSLELLSLAESCAPVAKDPCNPMLALCCVLVVATFAFGAIEANLLR
jgi:hypothetical protein